MRRLRRMREILRLSRYRLLLDDPPRLSLHVPWLRRMRPGLSEEGDPRNLPPPRGGCFVEIPGDHADRGPAGRRGIPFAPFDPSGQGRPSGRAAGDPGRPSGDIMPRRRRRPGRGSRSARDGTDSFGLYDLRLAVDLVRELGLPYSVVVNRIGTGDNRVQEYCAGKKIPVVLEIPDDRRIAEAYSRGRLIVETLPEYRALFERLAEKLFSADGERCGLEP